MWWEQYGYTAVRTAVEQCLFGAKAKPCFPEKPTLANSGNSEAEIQKQRELFVATLEAAKTRFELNKARKENEHQRD